MLRPSQHACHTRTAQQVQVKCVLVPKWTLLPCNCVYKHRQMILWQKLCVPGRLARERRNILAAASSSEASWPSSSRVNDAASLRRAEWATPLDDPWAALLMAWFASRGRSLLAAQCLVEAVLQLYISGSNLTQIQLGLKLASLTSQGLPADVAQRSGNALHLGLDLPSLLGEQEEQELLSWVALVLLAAQMAGVVPAVAAAAGDGNDDIDSVAGTTDGDGNSAQRFLQGMRGFVGQAYKQWQGGMTLQKLTDLQAAVNQGGTPPGGVQAVMQQYTRIAILSLDLMAAESLITQAEGNPSSGYKDDMEEQEEVQAAAGLVIRPTGYTSTFIHGPIACSLPSASDTVSGSGSGSEGVPAARRLAVRVLVAFMGTVLGSDYSLNKFVEAVYMAYTQGWSASEILDQLQDSDLAQSGGLIPIITMAEQQQQQQQQQSSSVQSITSSTASGNEGDADSSSGASASWDGSESLKPLRQLDIMQVIDSQDDLDAVDLMMQPPVIDGTYTSKSDAMGSDTGNAMDNGSARMNGAGPHEGSEGASTTASSSRRGSRDGSDGAAPGGVGLAGMLDDEDRPQQSAAAMAAAELGQVNRQLLASWLSSCYIALAQLGAPFPATQLRPGWAWAGPGGAQEAAGLDTFVRNALRKCVEDLAQLNADVLPDTEGDGNRLTGSGQVGSGNQADNDGFVTADTPITKYDGQGKPVQDTTTTTTTTTSTTSAAAAAVPGGPSDASDVSRWMNSMGPEQRQDLLELMEESRRQAAIEYLTTGKLRGKDLPRTLVRMQDDTLAATSSTVRLLSLQTQLVRATLALAMRLQQQQ